MLNKKENKPAENNLLEFFKNPNFHFPEGTYEDRVGYTHIVGGCIIIKSKPGYEGIINSEIKKIQKYAKELEQPLPVIKQEELSEEESTGNELQTFASKADIEKELAELVRKIQGLIDKSTYRLDKKISDVGAKIDK